MSENGISGDDLKRIIGGPDSRKQPTMSKKAAVEARGVLLLQYRLLRLLRMRRDYREDLNSKGHDEPIIEDK